MVVEDREGNTQLASLLLGALRGGDSDDVGQLAGAEQLAELGDDEGSGGAGAEAEDHAALDVVHGFVCGELFEVVLGQSWGGLGSYGQGSVSGGA